jgi:hypothetical protein
MLRTILLILLIFAIIWVIVKLFIRKRRDTTNLKSKPEFPIADIETTQDDSRWGTCKSCGQKRIIMNEEMCAYCWSMSQTHELK